MFEVIQCLLDAGADVNAADDMTKDNTPLHVSAFRCKADDVIRTLIRNGAKAWKMNDEGQSAADVVGRSG